MIVRSAIFWTSFIEGISRSSNVIWFISFNKSLSWKWSSAKMFSCFTEIAIVNHTGFTEMKLIFLIFEKNDMTMPFIYIISFGVLLFVTQCGLQYPEKPEKVQFKEATLLAFLLDNAPNYLVGCIIQKRLHIFFSFQSIGG